MEERLLWLLKNRNKLGPCHPARNFPTRLVLNDFLDHAGNAATCLIQSNRPGFLPEYKVVARHPFSFQIYIANGLTYSPTPAPQRFAMVTKVKTDSNEVIPVRADEEGVDEATRTTRQFLVNLYQDLQGGQFIQYYSLAVYFMPAGSSAEDCMAHYHQEKEYRQGSVWPMPKNYASREERDRICYQDLLLLVPVYGKVDLANIYKSNIPFPIDFVADGKTKILPDSWNGANPVPYDDEDFQILDQQINWMGVVIKRYWSRWGEGVNSSGDELAGDRLNRLAGMNWLWTDEDEGQWKDHEEEIIDGLCD